MRKKLFLSALALAVAGATVLAAASVAGSRAPTARAKSLKIGMVTDIGGLNVLGLLSHEEQVGYLAGYLAGLEAKRLGKTVVSSVGGQKQPPVDRFIAGYQAGANKAFPKVQAINGYSQSFDDQAKCKEVALNQ